MKDNRDHIDAVINGTGKIRSVRRNINTDSARYVYTHNGVKYPVSGYIGYDEYDFPIFFPDNKEDLKYA